MFKIYFKQWNLYSLVGSKSKFMVCSITLRHKSAKRIAFFFLYFAAFKICIEFFCIEYQARLKSFTMMSFFLNMTNQKSFQISLLQKFLEQRGLIICKDLFSWTCLIEHMGIVVNEDPDDGEILKGSSINQVVKIFD